MARRQRRGFFRKTAPDRGWWIAEGVATVTHPTPATDAAYNSQPILDFFDINADNVLITQDKSDWFIKRVLVELYPTLSRASATSAPARLYQMGLLTMMDADNTDLEGGVAPVLSAVTFDAARRVLRTYSRPVYATWQPQLITGASGALRTDAAAAIAGNAVAGEPWGEAHIRDDFEVSNASLVEGSTLYIACSTQGAGPGTYDWAVGDQLLYWWNARVLLQKRRV